MRYTHRKIMGTVLALALVSAACSSADDPAEGDPDAVATPSQQATPVEDPPSATAADTSIVVHDSLGETQLEEPCERVVALEWVYVEDVLALGVQPVGVADPEGYAKWVTTPIDLDEDVVDVGTRQEPSLESIAGLEPDCIFGLQTRHEPIIDQLENIAPTMLFNPYPEDPALSQQDEMIETLGEIAIAMGRQDAATAVLAEMEATFEAAREQVAAAGKDGSPFLVVQAFTSEGAPAFRVMTDHAMSSQQLQALGLTHAFEGEFSNNGFNTVGLEGFARHEDANFFYVVQPDDDVFAGELADNEVWQSLTFVQEGRTYPLGGDMWLFGGPLSAMRVAEVTADLLSQ